MRCGSVGVRRVIAVAAASVAAWMSGVLGASRDAQAEPLGARVALGHRIFFDAALSEPKGTSCASCHEPARAFAGDHGSGIGVPAGSRRGTFARRSTPSLLYLAFIPKFRFFSEDDDNHGLDREPYGGYFWDGRSDSIAALVRQPLLDPREMSNRDPAQIAAKLRRAPYAADFDKEFPGALVDPERSLGALGAALEAFLTTPAMAPFSSKYDDYVRGTATLSAKEQRGLLLFADPKRGGCARCHTFAAKAASPEQSMFTDYGYEAPGAPRNRHLRSRDEDRGLCGRVDAANPSDGVQYCASFRTPSLRNVALRPSFMHNGAFTRLRDVVTFYATRATHPERWYPSGVPFDDTPAPYRGLVDVTSVPYDRHPGDAPALDDEEIDAVVAFLGTLTDRLP